MNDELGGYVILVLLLGGLVTYVVIRICIACADAELLRTNPRAWRHKQAAKLEKERLAAERELAQERAKQENRRQTAGFLFGLGRGLRWW